MDSVCAAYAYAQLKNRIDPENTYIPVRCGHLNDSTKAQFERIGLVPPMFVKDVRTKVESVMHAAHHVLESSDPVYKLVSLYRQAHPASVVPIFDGTVYRGLLSIDEVNSFVLRENGGSRPLYHFVADNFPKVLRGRFLKKGRCPEFDSPIVVGAMRYDVFCKHIEALDGQRPVLVVGDREDHIRKAIELQIPAIVLTGIEGEIVSDVDFSTYEGTVFVSEVDTAETIRLLRLSIPVVQLISKIPPPLQTDCLFEEAKGILADSEFRGLPVFEGAEWKGFVTRRCFLERPKTKVIMVDHNETDQSVPGIEDAEVMEIIDHHRLGAPKTRNPIYISCEPLGSTCTIIFKHFSRKDIPIDRDTAKVLLSGIVSDTVILKSPTTTAEDLAAVEQLCVLAGVEDIHAFGQTMFSSGASLANAEPARMIEGDFKTYSEFGVSFGIGQCEVTTLGDIDDYKDRYLSQLEEVRRSHRLDWAMFLVTDVVKENSVLLSTSMPILERKLSYERQGDGKFFLPGVLSRKKQLLPEVLRVLEE
jgi:manganese-dependent inorganic pyrophosphatase